MILSSSDTLVLAMNLPLGSVQTGSNLGRKDTHTGLVCLTALSLSLDTEF